MKTIVTTITPKYAAELLTRNFCNRPLNTPRIKAYAEDMASDNWQLTHQGILIGKNDALIDGQNRLSAIVRAGVSVQMMVTFNQDIETPLHLPLDRGNARSLTYVLGKPHILIGSANLAYEFISNENRFSKSQIGIAITDDVCKQLESAYETLYCGSKNTAKNITVSPVVLACCIHIMLNHGTDYVVRSFNDMRSNGFTNLSPCTASFFKQIVIDKISMDRKELFCRAYKAFDVDNSNKSRLSISQNENAFNDAVVALKSVISINR